MLITSLFVLKVVTQYSFFNYKNSPNLLLLKIWLTQPISRRYTKPLTLVLVQPRSMHLLFFYCLHTKVNTLVDQTVFKYSALGDRIRNDTTIVKLNKIVNRYNSSLYQVDFLCRQISTIFSLDFVKFLLLSIKNWYSYFLRDSRNAFCKSWPAGIIGSII